MAQLPRVAVFGAGPAAETTLRVLVDSGLDAHLFVTRDVVGNVVGNVVDGNYEVRPVDDGRRPFDIRAGDQPATRWDVVVLTGGITGSIAEKVAPHRLTRSPAVPPPLFGGVFDPDAEGVYGCGCLERRSSSADPFRSRPRIRDRKRTRDCLTGAVAGRDLPVSGSTGTGTGDAAGSTDAVRLAEAQARWLGEYLRGRYLLPPRSAMLTAASTPRPLRSLRSLADDLRNRRLRPHHRSDVDAYLRWLGAEVRQGRARAAAGGYPLPVPSLITVR
ncbi:hypothetical protein [Protofrankia symbiont of Coriaria ruscifolia]|uniref:hypothetical protein n=1 Tax=Protofrankia symbiont of Coriaria ruscifolia TaxID=1306542 RepID=UPI0010417B52|nr:hypothetical protein [Protofrankia symbiont of Coriaria ruscifolia]